MRNGKPQLVIQAQRCDGAGWWQCAPHQAQRFAVVALVVWRASGRKMSRTRVLAAYATMAEAVADLNGRLRGASSSPKAPKLGGRWNRTADSPKAIVRGVGTGPVSLFHGTVVQDD